MKRVFTLFAVLAVAVLATMMVTERASAVPQEKVSICHNSLEDQQYVLIVVAPSAVPAHLAHGDLLLSEQGGGVCPVYPTPE